LKRQEIFPNQLACVPHFAGVS